MKISTRGRYGLRALVDIAANETEKCITLKSVAQREGISEHYLEQLITQLKKSGIVKSIRGAQGGYNLNRKASEISVGEVLAALEGPLYPVDCVSKQEGDVSACGVADCKQCVAKSVWNKLYDSLNDVLDSITLEDLVRDYKSIALLNAEAIAEKIGDQS